MSNKILEIKDLYVTYNTDEAEVCAVNGLNLTINAGETVGLVGETGAGKTTTALSIMRLLPERIGSINRGSIILDGEDIVAASEAKMRLIRGNVVSMIFQDPMTSLNPTLTVGDQISEVIKFHQKELNNKQIVQRVCEILELVGIPEWRRKEYPHQFSGGMKQRVVIAIALACEPKLLLADEPTTALDVTIQAQVLEMIKGLKNKFNTAMLLITHDLGVVARTCDKVGIMYAGEVIEFGTLEQVFSTNRHHPYTQGLFGAIPNMKKKERRLSPVDGLMPDPTNLPVGCKFNTRCPMKMKKCTLQQPDMYSKDGHEVRCFLFGPHTMGKDEIDD